MSTTVDPLTFSLDDVYRRPCVGKGTTREVYAISPEHVAKIELGPDRGQNRGEVERWQRLAGTPAAAYVAPVLAWADDFAWVIARRCSPLYAYEDATEEVRAFRYLASAETGAQDLHLANIGRDAVGNLVLMDYAN